MTEKNEQDEIQEIKEEFSEYIIRASDYRMIRQIGKGGYAEVWLARNKKNGEEVAFKQLFTSLQPKQVLHFAREVKTMLSVEHPFFLKFLGFSPTPPLILVSEYIPNGSLFVFMRSESRSKRLTPTHRNLIAMGIAHAMAYLHSLGIIHRDLKSLNILLDKSLLPRLGDFGIARFLKDDETMTMRLGTPHWMAPETLYGSGYGPEVDVYSFGMLLYELHTNNIPWEGMDAAAVIKAVALDNQRPEIPRDTPRPLANLIEACWQQDPSRRPKFADIYQMFAKKQVVFQGTELEAVDWLINYIDEKMKKKKQRRSPSPKSNKQGKSSSKNSSPNSSYKKLNIKDDSNDEFKSRKKMLRSEPARKRKSLNEYSESSDDYDLKRRKKKRQYDLDDDNDFKTPRRSSQKNLLPSKKSASQKINKNKVISKSSQSFMVKRDFSPKKSKRNLRNFSDSDYSEYSDDNFRKNKKRFNRKQSLDPKSMMKFPDRRKISSARDSYTPKSYERKRMEDSDSEGIFIEKPYKIRNIKALPPKLPQKRSSTEKSKKSRRSYSSSSEYSSNDASFSKKNSMKKRKVSPVNYDISATDEGSSKQSKRKDLSYNPPSPRAAAVNVQSYDSALLNNFNSQSIPPISKKVDENTKIIYKESKHNTPMSKSQRQASPRRSLSPNNKKANDSIDQYLNPNVPNSLKNIKETIENAQNLSPNKLKMFFEKLSIYLNSNLHNSDIKYILRKLLDILFDQKVAKVFIESGMPFNMKSLVSNSKLTNSCFDVFYALFKTVPHMLQDNFENQMKQLINISPSKSIILLANFSQNIQTLDNPWPLLDLMIRESSTFLKQSCGALLVSTLFHLCTSSNYFRIERLVDCILIFLTGLQSTFVKTIQTCYNALCEFYDGIDEVDFDLIANHLEDDRVSDNALNFLLRLDKSEIPPYENLVNSLFYAAKKNEKATLCLVSISRKKAGSMMILQYDPSLLWISEPLPTIEKTTQLVLSIISFPAVKSAFTQKSDEKKHNQFVRLFSQICEENDSFLLMACASILHEFTITENFLNILKSTKTLEKLLIASLSINDNNSIRAGLIILGIVGNIDFCSEYLLFAEKLKSLLVAQSPNAGMSVAIISLLSKYPLCAQKFKELNLKGYFTTLLKDINYRKQAEHFLHNIDKLTQYY